MHHVLNHHHRPVDHHSEVDRPEAHQVGRQSELLHADEGEEHGQGDYAANDQGAPNLAEEQKQHGDHQESALQKVLGHGIRGPFDEVGLIVELDDPDALGQAPVRLVDSRLDIPDHLATVAAPQHHDDAGHDLPVTVLRDPALPELAAELDTGDVPQVERPVLEIGQDDPAQILLPPYLTEPPHDVLLPIVFEVVASRDAVVLLDRLDDPVQSDAVRAQGFGVHHDVVLLHETAEGVDLGDSGHGLQLRCHQPVLDGAEFREAIPVSPNDVLIDLAEGGRDGSELGNRDALRQTARNRLDALTHDLAGEVDVGVFFELHRHRRKPEMADRAHLPNVGQPVQGRLDREADELLHFERGVSARLRDDQNLNRGHVRKRVYRYPGQGGDTADRHERNQCQSDEPLAKAPVEDAVQHRIAVPSHRGGVSIRPVPVECGITAPPRIPRSGPAP